MISSGIRVQILIANLPAAGVCGGGFSPTYVTASDGTPSTTSSTPSICGVSSGAVSFVGVGICSLQASVTAGLDFQAGTGSVQSFAVTKAVTSLRTAAGPGASVTLGSSPVTLTDAAVLAGGSTPGGTITFALYVPNDTNCSTPPVDSETATVAGDAIYATSKGYTLPGTGAVTGTYRWVASYSGDAGNTQAAGGCGDATETVSVGKAAPSLSTHASADVALGGSISDTATIAGGANPSGSLTFAVYGSGDPSCNGVPLAHSTIAVSGNGVYAAGLYKPVATGIYRWVASYTGDGNDVGASGSCSDAAESVEVHAPSVIAVPASVPSGTPLTASWSWIAAPASTDWIGVFAPGAANTAFLGWVYTSSCTRTAGSGKPAAGSCPIALPASPGSYQLRLFAADGYTLLASSGPITVTKATPTLTTQASAGAQVGGTVTDTATLAGGSTPTGTITFQLYAPADTTCTGSPVVTSTAHASSDGAYTSAAFAPPVAGSYRWIATYGGDATNAALADPCGAAGETVVVAPAPTLTVNVSTIAAGGAITVSWTGVSNPTTTDWIGAYSPAGAPGNQYAAWIYDDSCTAGHGAAAVASGSCAFTMPTKPGSYQLRLYATDGFTLLAVAPPVTVTAVPPPKPPH